MKKGIIHFIIYYSVIPIVLSAILLYNAAPYIVIIICETQGITYKSGMFNLFRYLVPGLLAVLWFCISFSTIREQRYKAVTGGRTYSSDTSKYKRSYFELTDYFKDADLMKMDKNELPSMSWRESGGLVFGKSADKLIGFEPEKNGICAMIWGAPGDGKTTSTIIPSAMRFGMVQDEHGKWHQKGSVMVVDMKGDIYDATCKYRNIKRFSTMHVEESAHYDPLVDARKMTSNDQAFFLENLAITIIPEEQGSDAKYFIDGAREFFTGISLYILSKDPTVSFPTIINAIVKGNYATWVTTIMNDEDPSASAAQAYTNHFYGENEKNVSGCYSKLVSSARLFATDKMKILLTNDENCISPQDLENCTDIYIQVDPNEIAIMGPLIAMLFQAFMSAMLYRQAGQQPPIAFIMDEFGQIPAMPVIAKSAALMRAYNCSLMFSCQSLAMIDKHYGETGRKLLMDCVKAHCFLSIMDPDTRTWASRLIGTRKVLKISNSLQQSGNVTAGKSVTEDRSNVFEPESFGDLPNEDALVIYYKGKYIKAQKTYYFKQ